MVKVVRKAKVNFSKRVSTMIESVHNAKINIVEQHLNFRHSIRVIFPPGCALKHNLGFMRDGCLQYSSAALTTTDLHTISHHQFGEDELACKYFL